jgi:hypothetical protein
MPSTDRVQATVDNRTGGLDCAHPGGKEATRLAPQDSAGHGIELLEKLRIARFGGCDQGVVERPVGTDRARLVLARKIAG